jgi:negative regulator of flagellin synthesis FlgM
MKVYGNKPPEKQDALAKAQKVGKADQTPEKGLVEKINPVDRVDLSGKAKGMAEMLNTINQLPEIRADKVAEIQKSVNDGTYRVDPNKVASKMIDELV